MRSTFWSDLHTLWIYVNELLTVLTQFHRQSCGNNWSIRGKPDFRVVETLELNSLTNYHVNVKFIQTAGRENIDFVLKTGFWNQYNICICNVLPQKVQANIQQWICSEFEVTFQNFEGIINLWPGFQPHSPITATSACLWLMSFTWHFQRLIRSQTEGSCGRPPPPLIYIWMWGLIVCGTADWEWAAGV